MAIPVQVGVIYLQYPCWQQNPVLISIGVVICPDSLFPDIQETIRRRLFPERVPHLGRDAERVPATITSPNLNQAHRVLIFLLEALRLFLVRGKPAWSRPPGLDDARKTALPFRIYVAGVHRSSERDMHQILSDRIGPAGELTGLTCATCRFPL
jgi:hypothetical protein